MKKSILIITMTIFAFGLNPLSTKAQVIKSPEPNYGDFSPNSLPNNNIGIATLPPSTGKLAIKADTYWWDFLRFIPGGKVSEGHWTFHNPRYEDKLHIGWHTIDPSDEFWNLTLTQDAKVGINTISPLAHLDVNGTVLVHSGENHYLSIDQQKFIFGSKTFQIEAAFNGKIFANEVEVNSEFWPDFVFTQNYKLLPLMDLENFIKQHKHLPEIPSVQDVLENGIELGEMNALLLMKIEELTLYVIELKKELDDLKNHKSE